MMAMCLGPFCRLQAGGHAGAQKVIEDLGGCPGKPFVRIDGFRSKCSRKYLMYAPVATESQIPLFSARPAAPLVVPY